MEIRRKVKNVVYKYSEPERLVREATSNDPWGPTSTVMSEIADMTHDMEAFEEIMQIIWKRLNDKGKNWRHVYKCLVLLDYLIKCGDEKVATLCISNIHSIETLKDFQYFEEHKDFGLGVREKSKTLVALLKDDEILSIERKKGQKVKEKFQGPKSALGSHQRRRPGDLGREIRRQQNEKEVRFSKSVIKLNFDDVKNDAEDEDLQKAIALSKEEHEKSMKKKEEEDRLEELKIKMAMEQSKKEEEALSVLRPPPRTKDAIPELMYASSEDNHQSKKTLYQMCEASRVLEELNGFGEVESSDPWGSPGAASVSLDFDPWKTAGTPQRDEWAPAPQGRSIIDDIFGDDKPNLSFDSPWGAEVGHTSDLNGDLWATPIGHDSHSRGGLSGSLASLTDLGIPHADSQMQHSCSVMNLAPSAAATRPKKTPQEFLGENANLVNLENLLPTPKAAQKNPFGGMSTNVNNNPFNSLTVQTKKPMNQMAAGNTQPNMFSSSGNLNFNGMNSNFNSYSQPPQPYIPNSQSQYHGFPVAGNPYNTGNGPWGQQPMMVPAGPWPTHASNNTPNPFFN